MLEGGAKGIAGTAVFKAWAGRKAVAETRRPGLVNALAALTVLASLLYIAEGILIGWFLPHITPADGLEDILFRQLDVASPAGTKLAVWLAAATLLMIGTAAFAAGIALPGGGRPAAYFTVAAVIGLLVTGAIWLYSGFRFHSGWFTGLGCANLGLWLALSILLGLSWYTLDPLGLHAEPS